MNITARFIDDACRQGLYVYTGNRQRILGADNGSDKPLGREKPPPGHVWIHHAGTLAWELVPLTSVTIENRKDDEMPQGKGRPGAVTHIKPKKRDEDRANNGNLELPGVEVDQRKIKLIEDAEEARQAAVEQLNKAHENLEERRLDVIKAMHKHGFDAESNPLYMRNPWGGVVLTATGGEVKESVKFIKAKAKKKKGEEEDDE